jgi:hypothetical protein
MYFIFDYIRAIKLYFIVYNKLTKVIAILFFNMGPGSKDLLKIPDKINERSGNSKYIEGA